MVKTHIIYTFASRKINRTYGGEEYTLNVWQNKGKGKIIHLGNTTQTTRSHCGFETEAFHVALEKIRGLKKRLQTYDTKGFNGYWKWQYGDECGVKLQQL